MTTEPYVEERSLEMVNPDALWNSPAFNMIDDIFYVGNRVVSSHLITSEKGHILIDTGMPNNGLFILKSIIDLGFNPKDIKYILITHAHFDHLGSKANSRQNRRFDMHRIHRRRHISRKKDKNGLDGFQTVFLLFFI